MKEFYSDDTKEKKIGRRDFIKKTLSGLGALWLGSYAKAIESALSQPRENILNEKAPEKIIARLNYIVEKIGNWSAIQLGDSRILYLLENLEDPAKPEIRKELIEKLCQKPEIKKTIKEPAIMDGLKEIGLNPEVVREFLKTLPKSWRKEVVLITYLNKPTEAILNKVTGDKSELVAHHQSKGKAEPSEIYFFPGAKKKKPEDDLLPFLVYEYAHVNNWRNRADLTLGQRICLLYEVIKRAESPDRFKYEMVEKISREDKKEELAKKAIEYWAAISMYSLMQVEPTKDNPNTLPPEADMKLVFDYLKMTDPDFDILKMAEKRLEILKSAKADREDLT